MDRRLVDRPVPPDAVDAGQQHARVLAGRAAEVGAVVLVRRLQGHADRDVVLVPAVLAVGAVAAAVGEDTPGRLDRPLAVLDADIEGVAVLEAAPVLRRQLPPQVDLARMGHDDLVAEAVHGHAGGDPHAGAGGRRLGRRQLLELLAVLARSRSRAAAAAACRGPGRAAARARPAAAPARPGVARAPPGRVRDRGRRAGPAGRPRRAARTPRRSRGGSGCGA